MNRLSIGKARYNAINLNFFIGHGGGKKLAMRKMYLTMGFTLVVLIGSLIEIPAQNLLTRAEQSNFTETSRYADVLNWLYQLQQRSSEIAVTSIGRSIEGRDILLAILGRPVPTSPTQLFIMNKPAIYIQANIHAGEVEGKEAMLMLMRDILLGSRGHLLDHQVLLIVPNFNPDGNEKISPDNRRNQLGPSQGVGVRYNGQNLDLNRDYIKLETPENRAAVEQVLNRWDPMLMIDLHTTNGSYHQEPLTYATAHNPNGDGSLIRYVRSKLFPEVAKQLKTKYGIMSVPYGDFVDDLDPAKGWQSFDHQPYYSTNYWGLRNRFSILNENYAYADYQTRIQACYHFVELILEYTHRHGAEMMTLIREVDQETIARGQSADRSAQFGIEIVAKPLEQPLLIHSYEFERFVDANGRTRVKKTDRLRDYTVPFFEDFTITKSVVLPKGYIFSSNLKEIAEILMRHGIRVEQIAAPDTFRVQTFQIESIQSEQQLMQGHRWTRLSGRYQSVDKIFPAGSFIVKMDQPLANLIAYLLEPESDGGLVKWNFFDRYLYASQWSRQMNQFPVYRLMQPVRIATTIVNKSNCHF